MMRYIALLVSLAVFLAGCGQTQAVREERAANAILKLGGKVIRAEKLPGRPIVEVDLSGTKVTDSDLKDLKELKGLEKLVLWATEITDAGLKDLKELKGLKRLYLGRTGRTQITDAGMKDLKELKGLQTLGLSNTQITDAGLKDLQRALPNTTIYGP